MKHNYNISNDLFRLWARTKRKTNGRMSKCAKMVQENKGQQNNLKHVYCYN